MFQFVLVFFLLICALSLTLCTSVFLAMWLVFGRPNLFIRMPTFLLLTIPLGYAYCLVESRDLLVLIPYYLGVMCISGFWTRAHVVVRSCFLGAGIFLLLPVVLSLFQIETVNAAWFGRVAIGTSLIALALFLMSWNGIKIINLTGGANSLEIERKSGRDLDGWIETLQKENAQDWNRATTMAFLREFGMGFEIQKTISIAYEKFLGKEVVGIASDGKLQVVAQEDQLTANAKKRNWIRQFEFENFSIWQMMLITFCVACLASFITQVSGHAPTAIDFAVGLALAMVSSVFAIPMTLIFLSVGTSTRSKRLGWKAIRASRIFVFSLLGLILIGSVWANLLTAPWVILSVTIYLGWLSAMLTLASHRGYRMVRIEHIERPVVSGVLQMDDLANLT